MAKKDEEEKEDEVEEETMKKKEEEKKEELEEEAKKKEPETKQETEKDEAYWLQLVKDESEKAFWRGWSDCSSLAAEKTEERKRKGKKEEEEEKKRRRQLQASSVFDRKQNICLRIVLHFHIFTFVVKNRLPSTTGIEWLAKSTACRPPKPAPTNSGRPRRARS